jgi:hypothetical protein
LTNAWKEWKVKQPERDSPEQRVISVDSRFMFWLGLALGLVAVLGLGLWMGLSVTRFDASAFDPYATSAPTLAQVPQAPGVAAPVPQSPSTVLLPPPRADFEPEPENFAVMGDPNAPITIVEYSDYQ